VFQSIGATAVVAPPLALGLGVVTIATGLVCVLSGQGRSSNTGGGRTTDDSGDDHYDDNDFEDCGCSYCTEGKGSKKPEKS
jgi:hypothetical protein